MRIGFASLFHAQISRRDYGNPVCIELNLSGEVGPELKSKSPLLFWPDYIFALTNLKLPEYLLLYNISGITIKLVSLVRTQKNHMRLESNLHEIFLSKCYHCPPWGFSKTVYNKGYEVAGLLPLITNSEQTVEQLYSTHLKIE